MPAGPDLAPGAGLGDAEVLAWVSEYLASRRLVAAMRALEIESGANGCPEKLASNQNMMFLRNLVLDGHWDQVRDDGDVGEEWMALSDSPSGKLDPHSTAVRSTNFVRVYPRACLLGTSQLLRRGCTPRSCWN